MKIRYKIASGVGLAAFLCCALAANTADQSQTVSIKKAPAKEYTFDNSKFVVKRVDGVPGKATSQTKHTKNAIVNDLSGTPHLATHPGPDIIILPDLSARGGACGNVSEEITQNASLTVEANASIARCQAGGVVYDNSWARCFSASDFVAVGAGDYILQCVRIGISVVTNPGPDVDFPVDLRISIDTDGCGPDTNGQFSPWSTIDTVGFTVIHEQKVVIPGGFQGLFNVTLTSLVTIPAGSDILFEIHNDSRIAGDGGDGGDFIVGGNTSPPAPAGTIGDTWIWSEGCALLTYGTLAALNFPAQWVVVLQGTFGASNVNGACCDNAAGTCVNTTLDLCPPNDRFAAGVMCSDVGVFVPPCGTPIPNDECDPVATGGSPLTPLTGSVCVPFFTTIATDTAGAADVANVGSQDPFDDCKSIFKDVWFKYTVQDLTPSSTAGRLVISTLGSDFDTEVIVYKLIDQDAGTPGVQIGTPAQICASIIAQATGDGSFAKEPLNGCSNDIPNRPSALINANTYIPEIAGASPGDVYYIRVGSPFIGVGGTGVLNIDYLPETPLPWVNANPGNGGGTCCFPDGTCTYMINTFTPDCAGLGGFFTEETNFYEGRDPSNLVNDPNDPTINQLFEFSVGCKAFACPKIGQACWNAIDLRKLLLAKNGTAQGTATRMIRKKLYYKYQLTAGTSLVIDTCGSDGFDSVIEIFKFANCSDPTIRANGKPITKLNPDLTGGVNNDLIIQNDLDGDITTNIPLFDDDCIFGTPAQDADFAARGAGDPIDGASCFNGLSGGEVDSCLCLTVDGAVTDGLAAGDTILICIGAINPDRQATGVESIDPAKVVIQPDVLASISIKEVAQCFSCAVNTGTQTIDGNQVTPMNLEMEPQCMDAADQRNNEGCSTVLSLSGIVQTTNIDVAATTFPKYITGSSGFFNPPGTPAALQIEDQDWYKITLTQRKLVTWRMVAAEFLAEFAILQVGSNDPCNVNAGFAVTTFGPCDADTGGVLTVDCCPGTYYLTVRALPPFVPADCAMSNYVMCLDIKNPATPTTCCKGDVNNDGVINAFDIQSFTDRIVNPPQLGEGLALGGCGLASFCSIDINGDGALTSNDVTDAFPNGFVALLLNPPACDPAPNLPALCNDPTRCQLPDQQGAVRSDLNLNQDIDNPVDGQGFDFTATFRITDNFTANETGMITGICWWGTYRDLDVIAADGDMRDCLPTVGDNFTISYFESVIDPQINDNCPGSVILSNTPGRALFSQSAGTLVSVTRVSTGNTILFPVGNGTEYQYTATHAPVPVEAGKCYWVEIYNDTTGGRCVWDWETSAEGDNNSFQSAKLNQPQVLPTAPKYDSGHDCLRDPNAGDMAFCVNVLIGDNGCAPSNLFGRCCFGGLGNETCIETTQDDCAVNFAGNFDLGITCAVPCNAGQCRVNCLPGDMIEAEGCGFDVNGGCDFDSGDPRSHIVSLGNITCSAFALPSFLPDVANDPAAIKICGTAPTRVTQNVNGGNTTVIDSDWYLFDTFGSGQSSIIITIEAGFDATVTLRQLVDPANPPPGSLTSDDCQTFVTLGDTTFTDSFGTGDCKRLGVNAGCLTEGEFVVVVDGSFTQTVDCLDATYRLTITCFPCCAFAIPCPGAAVKTESELPGAQSNNGCSQTVPGGGVAAFEPLVDQFNQPITDVTGFCAKKGGFLYCGTVFADQATRDEDWWGPFTVPEGSSQTLKMVFSSEFPGIADFVEVGNGSPSDCLLQNLEVSSFFAFSGQCNNVNFIECLPPGNWVVRVRPGSNNRLPINEGTPIGSTRNHYVFRIKCTLPDGTTPNPNNTATCIPQCDVDQNGQLPQIQGVNVLAFLGQNPNPNPALITDIVNGNSVVAFGSDLNLFTNDRSADSFLVVSDGTVSKVTWWGFYESNNGQSCVTSNPPVRDCTGSVPQLGDAPDDFTITYYSNQTTVSGLPPFPTTLQLPDTVIAGPFHQGAGLTITSKAATGAGRQFKISNVPEDCIGEVQYTATHAPFAVTAGECVWVEIVNNTTGGCTWFWETSKEGELASVQQNPDPQNPQIQLVPGDPYSLVDEFRFTDLSFCVDVNTGPTGCFQFSPAPNDVCSGAQAITCDPAGSTDTFVTFDLVNYSSQGPLVDPVSSQEFNSTGIPFGLEKESSLWFKITPASTGTVTISLVNATFAWITLFNGGAGCGSAPGDIGDLFSFSGISKQESTSRSGAPPAPIIQTLNAGVTYYILVNYDKGTRPRITDSLIQQIEVTCVP